MASERRLRILTGLVGGVSPQLDTLRLCLLSTELTGVTGAGLMLFSGGVSQGSLGTTDDVSAHLEELQFTLGEGPCIDACTSGRPVLEPDLVEASNRWLAFSPPAISAGARAVFGLPVRVGAVQLGALNLYRDRWGPLGDEQHANALVLANVAAEMILLLQANAPAGQVAAELGAGADFHYVVHQASGMVAAQLDVSVSQSLVRLRAHAFANDVPLAKVARAIVDRTMRFSKPDSEETPS